MKSFSIMALTSLAIAFAGIMYTNGVANVISYVSCIPLVCFVGFYLVDGIRGFIRDNKSK